MVITKHNLPNQTSFDSLFMDTEGVAPAAFGIDLGGCVALGGRAVVLGAGAAGSRST